MSLLSSAAWSRSAPQGRPAARGTLGSEGEGTELTSDRKPPQLSLNSRIDGPEIDLDREEVYLSNGQRLTEALRREIVDEVLGKRRRPALRRRRGPSSRSAGRARHDAS